MLPFIRRILVWNNNPAVELRLAGGDVEVIRAGRNHGCCARYLCATRAETDLDYTQDDDVLVHNADEVLAAHLERPDRMAHGLASKHYAARADLVFGAAQLGWLGWGAVLDRSWLALLDDLPADVRSSRLFDREADVYFSKCSGGVTVRSMPASTISRGTPGAVRRSTATPRRSPYGPTRSATRWRSAVGRTALTCRPCGTSS